MFKIVDFQSFPDGKTRLTIETDDFTTSLMLRLFSRADKFAHLLHYRMTTESRLEENRLSEPERMAQMKYNRVRMLEEFRKIPGTRSQRLKILQEMCIGDGVNITQDRLSAQLSLALEDEKENYLLKIKRLIRRGKSFREIGAALGLPASTVARYARKIRGAKQASARVKRPVLTLAERPPEPTSTSDPASTLPPCPDIA